MSARPGKAPRDLAIFCEPDRASWIGNSNHIQWRDGHAVLTFGKHSGKRLIEIDPSYVKWMSADGRAGSFPRHVVRLCKQALELGKRPDEFYAWVAQTFGAPPRG
jgi:uncharacterized protein (DUF3820 family)